MLDVVARCKITIPAVIRKSLDAMIADFGRFTTPLFPRPERPDLAGVAVRLFDGNSAERTASENAFVLFHDELVMVYEPCLVITNLEKLRVEFGTGPAAYAQAVVNRR
jgi:hypothetical protein